MWRYTDSAWILHPTHERADVEVIRYVQLLMYCEKKPNNPNLTAYAAWVRALLKRYTLGFVRDTLATVGVVWPDPAVAPSHLMIDHDDRHIVFEMPPFPPDPDIFGSIVQTLNP